MAVISFVIGLILFFALKAKAGDARSIDERLPEEHRALAELRESEQSAELPAGAGRAGEGE